MTLPKTLLALTLLAAGCGNGSVASEEDARKAYLGLDASIDKAIQLGFDGYNTSMNGANISPQTANGAFMGTLTVTGKVDQGTSNNKNMTLNTAYVTYSDDTTSASDAKVLYDTDPAALPVLVMSLKNIPTGTLEGSLSGSLTMTGALKNKVTLALQFNATLMSGPNMTVVRAPGTTHITGTATSDYGTYTINVTR